MAKKTKESIVNAKSISSPKSEKSGYRISELIHNIAKKTSIIIENDVTKRRSYISTGIYVLDALLARSILHGGVAKNRITVFAGDPQTGKSYICYGIARNAQKEGYHVIYIDTEYSIELSDLQEYGVDVSEDKCTFLRSNRIEDLKIALAQLLNKMKEDKLAGIDIGKTIIVLDSIGQTASKKEIEDAIKGKDTADLSRAKALKGLFRVITSDLGFLDIGLVCTNHIYMTMDLFPKAVMNGGKGGEYSSSTIVYLTIAKLETGEEETDKTATVGDLGSSGVIVTAKSRKNRLARPKKIKFEIDHSKGANPYKGLDYFCSPENFDKVGIAKVKKEVDKSTGEIIYKPGATKFYVKHLDESFYEKQLYQSKIFTQEVLEALDPIIDKFFAYNSYEEQLEIMRQMDEEYAKFEKDDDLEIDNVTDDKLFD